MALPHRTFWMWTTVSLFALSTALVPIAYLSMPALIRWRLLAMLESDDAIDRARALTYLQHHAADDPPLRAGAVARLHAAQDARFIDIVAALNAGGVWRRPAIPTASWLRWVSLMAASPQPDVRIGALQQASQLTDLADDPRVLGILENLIADNDPQVRYNALVAVAELAGAARTSTAHHRLILAAAADAEPVIARQAWILVGLLRPSSGQPSNWRAAPPSVAAAMIWASVQTDPGPPVAALDALSDPAVAPAVRALAAYALHDRPLPAVADAALDAFRHTASQPLDDDARTLLWRLILAMPRDPLTPTFPACQPLDQWAREHLTRDPALLPLTLAVGHRLRRVYDFPPDPAETWPTLAHWAHLAAIEGSPPGQAPFPPLPDMPHLLRLNIAAATSNPAPADLRPMLESSISTLRDQACLVAAQRLTRDQLEPLIVSLLNSLSDDAVRSGAILSGLTGLAPEALARREAIANTWAIRQILRVGLWMQGRLPPEEQARMDRSGAAVLVEHPDLPMSTLLLALLHRGHPLALDILLNPRGELRYDLPDLLGQQRWWRVLSHYLPAVADNPPVFWPWADADLQAFQIEVLRSWYLLHRAPCQARWRAHLAALPPPASTQP